MTIFKREQEYNIQILFCLWNFAICWIFLDSITTTVCMAALENHFGRMSGLCSVNSQNALLLLFQLVLVNTPMWAESEGLSDCWPSSVLELWWSKMFASFQKCLENTPVPPWALLSNHPMYLLNTSLQPTLWITEENSIF